MAGIEEGCAVPQLQCAIAGRGRAVSPILHEIDVTLAGEIKSYGDCGRQVHLSQGSALVYRAGTAAACSRNGAGATTRRRSTSTNKQK
jgi:hypothetical protein